MAKIYGNERQISSEEITRFISSGDWGGCAVSLLSRCRESVSSHAVERLFDILFCFKNLKNDRV